MSFYTRIIFYLCFLMLSMGCEKKSNKIQNQRVFGGEECNARISSVLTMVEKWNKKYGRDVSLSNFIGNYQNRTVVIEFGAPQSPTQPQVHTYYIVKEGNDTIYCFYSNSILPVSKRHSAGFDSVINALIAIKDQPDLEESDESQNIYTTNPIVLIFTLSYSDKSRSTFVKYDIPVDVLQKWE